APQADLGLISDGESLGAPNFGYPWCIRLRHRYLLFTGRRDAEVLGIYDRHAIGGDVCVGPQFLEIRPQSNLSGIIHRIESFLCRAVILSKMLDRFFWAEWEVKSHLLAAELNISNGSGKPL